MSVAAKAKQGRTDAVNELKRGLILSAAWKIFERDGLEGASLRAIAAEAGYTPAALYFHFESKEALYAELLQNSLIRLRDAVTEAAGNAATAAEQLRAAAIAFFSFYSENPRDLDLGFYLFRGGMKPKGLGRERDDDLNAALGAALQPIEAAAIAMGASPSEARLIVAETFAHASGLLLLAHTGRIKMFDAAPIELMARHMSVTIRRLETRAGTC